MSVEPILCVSPGEKQLLKRFASHLELKFVAL
jgi:hypothetical protein